jgi:hypothetical protein
MSPASAVVRGEELWFYYSGLKYRGLSALPAEERRDLDSDSSAICLAVLRRDGFISLDADETGGSVCTEPFALAGAKLFVNIDAFGGELRVDMLDAEGEARVSSTPITGDHARAEVAWEHGNIGEYLNREVSCRFTLHDAEFYSYWFE